MRNTLYLASIALSLSIGTAHAAENLLPTRDFAALTAAMAAEPAATTADAQWRKRWTTSLAPLAASQSLDAASSYGRRELNPLLAGRDGGFGMKATGIKFGVTGALVGIEYFLVRKYPRSAKFFTIVNWTAAGATTGLAVHNFRLPR